MSDRLLLVECSAAMRTVLAEHLGARGFSVDETDQHEQAIERLDRRFEAFRGDYSAVVLGWPAGEDESVRALLARLHRDDLIDVPVVVMSTDLRASARAWSGSRERTVLLPWKRYREIDTALARLLGHRHAVGATDRIAVPAEREASTQESDDNGIHLLIVDDSATIRRSLEDLFAQRGYRVSVVSGPAEAMTLAVRTPVDVAVVDFYLEQSTGDELVHELVTHEATGEIVCAVLTGTYSDHIIRRSLRAGALECLFKNESSELLLNRVEALSRFVRQRRTVAEERRLLDRVFDVVAGCAVVLGADDTVRHVSREAIELLGHDDGALMVGRPFAQMIGPVELPAADGEVRRSAFRCADGSSIDLLVERRPLDPEAGSVLQFAPASALQALDDPSDGTAGSLHDTHLPSSVLAPSADRFVALLQRCLSGEESIAACASLLVIGVWLPASDDDAARPASSLRAHPDIEGRLTPLVLALYRRADHVAALGGGRYAFLLRHSDQPQSWLLTRKLMQLINDAFADETPQRMATSAVLKLLDGESGDAERLLGSSLDMLSRVEQKGLDRALLVDPRRMLGVYPAPGR